MLALLQLLLPQDSLYTHAESLLAQRNLPAARQVAERLVAGHPDDSRAHFLLGRIWFFWPTIGRYQALEQLRTAARLSPQEPEPLYWQIMVGDRLGSDEGERMMREAILKIFALQPDYRDCWETFSRLYHSADIWRQADRALARHPEDPAALAHRAEIAIALEEADRADSLAALVLTHRPHEVQAYLWRTEAAFQQHRDAAGFAWYDSALTYADLDSTEAIWEQTWAIASSDEIRVYERTGAGQLRLFYEWFWGKRDPNLTTPENERLAEHYRRLAYVRNAFHLLHPQSMYYRSPLRRALVAAGGRTLANHLVPEGTDSASLPNTSRPVYRTPGGVSLLGSRDSAAFFSGAGPDSRSVADTNGRLQTTRAGLDPRGLLYLRHGPPDERVTGVLDPLHPQRVAGADLDLESWLYDSRDGPLTIAFVRGSAGLNGGRFGGDFIFYPVTGHQVRSAEQLLATDETRVPAELPVRRWIVFFRGESPNTTVIYAKAVAPRAAMVFWDARTGEEVTRASGAGLLAATLRPGVYALGFDVADGDKMGRSRGQQIVPAVRPDTITVAGIALAPGDSLLGREAALAAMPADLSYRVGAPLVAYAEVYGVRADSLGRARYQVRYTFAPVRGGGAVVIEFTRETPARPVVPEQLVLEAGRVRTGRYRVSMVVTDLATGATAQTRGTEITVR